VIAVGPFTDIRFIYRDQLQSFDKETTEKINKTWQGHLQEKPDDVPGILAHTLSIEEYNGTLECHLQKTRYDIFLGTREPGKIRVLPKNKPWEENYSLPLSFGAVTITSDNAIICGVRGRTGLESNMLTTLPSGYLNPDIHAISLDYARGRKTLSFLSLVIAELKEELNIDWFEKSQILGVAQDCAGSQQPSIYIRLRVPFTSNEVRQKAEEAEKEIEKLVFLNNNIMSVRRAQQENYQWTGHDYGKLMFHFALPE
jgi:hypothetical protein